IPHGPAPAAGRACETACPGRHSGRRESSRRHRQVNTRSYRALGRGRPDWLRGRTPMTSTGRHRSGGPAGALRRILTRSLRVRLTLARAGVVPGTATLTGAGQALGTYTVTVTGSSGAITHSQQVAITVT